MQLIALPIALALLGATGASSSPPSASADEPQAVIREVQPGDLAGRQCRNVNLPADDNSGRQPRFEREPATPDTGQIIYAVDRRIDGCSVILVKYGISDIRRLLKQSDVILPASPPEQGK